MILRYALQVLWRNKHQLLESMDSSLKLDYIQAYQNVRRYIWSAPNQLHEALNKLTAFAYRLLSKRKRVLI